MIDFEGQVAVVTGAGRGLGRLYAIELARRGASVVVNDLGGIHARRRRRRDPWRTRSSQRSPPPAGRRWRRTTRSTAPRAVRRSCAPPSSSSDGWTRWSATRESSTASPFDELTPDDWRRMLRVHLDGGFYLAQPAYRVMKTQGYGRFVFISSSAGMFGQHLEAHYAAAKAGLVGLTNVIALEGAPHGILANTVLPFGFSRMVTETVGDPKALEESGFLTGDQARARHADRGVPGQPGLRVQPPQLLGLRRPLRPGVHRPRRRLAAGARHRPTATRLSKTSRPTSPRSRRPSRSRFPSRSTRRSSRCPSGWESSPTQP